MNDVAEASGVTLPTDCCDKAKRDPLLRFFYNRKGQAFCVHCKKQIAGGEDDQDNYKGADHE